MGNSDRRLLEKAYFPVMPKGVEHVPHAAIPLNAARAYFPVMPKGVEHRLREADKSMICIAYFPVMPKGVEHEAAIESLTPERKRAYFPVMPKGVEHYRRKQGIEENEGVFSCDAERR